MTTPTRTTRTQADDYPTGDPVSMTQVIGEPYETTDERGQPVGIAEHIVAVTGVVDEVGDVFVPGAFMQAMKRVKAKGVSGHDWGTKVSKALEREEWLPGDRRIAERIIPALPEGKTWPQEAGAVYVKAQYNLNTPEGKRAYENAKFYGADECFSVGYKVRPGGARKRGGKRYLSDFDWYEWSDVLHGANTLAFGLSVKGLLDSELERSGGRLAKTAGKPAGVEEKARLVRDSAYWGLPLGTPILPGMKPRGPKANQLRRAGAEVSDTAGAVEVTGNVQRVKPVAGGKRKMDKNPDLWGQMLDQVVEGFFVHEGDVAGLDATEDAHAINKGKEYNPLDVMVDNAVTPAELGDALLGEDWDDKYVGDSEANRSQINAYIEDLVQTYRQRYRARLAEQNDSGDGIVGDLADAAVDITDDELVDAGRGWDGPATADPDAPPTGRAIPPENRPVADLSDEELEAERAALRKQGRTAEETTRFKELGEERQKRRDTAHALKNAEYWFNQIARIASSDKRIAMFRDLPSKQQKLVREELARRQANNPDLPSTQRLAWSLSQMDGDPAADLPATASTSGEAAAVTPAAADASGVDEAVTAELEQLVDDPGIRAIVADVVTAPDVDTARQMGREVARREETEAAAIQAEASGVREFVERDKRGYPAVAAGLDNLEAFEGGALEPREDVATTSDTDTAADTGEDDETPAEEIISADELADAESAAADAFGLIEADDGEFEVTADVADRQDRVESLVEGGEDAVKALTDVQLPDARRDVVDELALQEEIARRERERRRDRRAATPAGDESAAETSAEDVVPGAEEAAAAPDGVGEGDEPAAPAEKPEKAKTRAGLAGAAEDYADALESGDAAAAEQARARLESSLRRSRSVSESAQALRDLLAGDETPDPARLRELATAMRDEARGRRNAQARSRRLAKRLERERLRSLLGQIDAEMRTRGLAAPNENAGGDKVGPTEDEGVISAEELAAAAPLEEAPADLETRIRTAYEELSVKPQDWVRLSKLHEKLGDDVDKSEVDKILVSMVRTGFVHLAPNSDRKNLTDADRATAIRIGGEDKHLIAIEPAEMVEDLPPDGQSGGSDAAEHGVWSDLGTMPIRVSGAHYEASVRVDPDQPDQFMFRYQVTAPGSSELVHVGSGKEASVDDARRAVVQGLADAFNEAPEYGGVPEGERLPDMPDAVGDANLPASNIGEGGDDTTDEGVLSPDDLAAAEQATQEGATDGQDRGPSGEPLAEVPPGGVLEDQGSGDVLPEPGDRGGAADRGIGGGVGAGAAAGGDDAAAGGLDSQRPAGSGVGGVAGDGAAAGGGGPAGRGGDPGGPGAAAGDDRLPGGTGRPGGDAEAGDAGRADDAGLTDPGVTERDQPQPDVAAVNRVPTTGTSFTPTGTESFAPSGKRAKLDANMDALRTLRVLQSEDPPRPATPEEQQILARWAGWGGLPEVFDDTRPEYAAEREELRALLSPEELNAAKRNTLNAHYTDPRAVSAIWQAVQDLGITQGRVLEPGSGSGNFIGLAPEGMDMLGVELDPTTAAMSKYLYPDAEIRNESFARSRFPDGAFDASVGNVPFGDFKLTDRDGNKGRHSIHNHFIIKSLKATRPGGVAAVLTSRYTMDSLDSKARAEMAELGDLLGAVRLPTGSHRAASGTDVIEDVLIFRRREDGAEPATDQGWVEASKQDVPAADGGTFGISLNSYWEQHPDHVLGTMRAEKGRFGTGDLLVDADGRAEDSLTDDLAAALRSITDEANASGLGATQREGAAPELVDTTSAGAGGRYEGNISVDTSSGDPKKFKFTQVAGGEVIDVTDDIPASARAEFAALVDLRSTFGALLDAETATSTDTPRIIALRAELNTRYDRYVNQYGAVTRYTYTKSGARQRPAAVRLFRRDPKSAGIRALESNYDPAGDGGKGSWSRASIFRKRSAAPREIAGTADNPKDALALSLESTGRIDLPMIGEMLGLLQPQPGGPNRMQDTSQVRAALGDLVFEGPDLTSDQEDLIVRLERARTLGHEPAAADADAALELAEQAPEISMGPLETASAYLSGDVRRKLAVARYMARHDARYEANVAALESVLPEDLGPSEIDARLGASWIPPEVVRDFVRDLHGLQNDRFNEVQVAQAGSVWTVVGPKYGNAATEEWGTDRRTAADLVQAMLEQRPIRITTKGEDGKSVYDLNATLAAQAKVEALAERFAEWAWEDPERSRRLADNYNWQFNSIALRNYDGAERTFPGMAAEFVPRPHQVAAVERIVNEPTALLGHVVGAGKTAEMVMGTAELKRLGLARKPAIVVPNHMLEQFTREYLEIYPNANVLAAGSDDLVGDKRKEFVARAATGDWDAVILTQKAFEAIPMSPDQQEAYIQRELADMKLALEQAQADAAARGDDAAKKTVKQMEKALLRAEEAMRKKLDKEKDSAVSFEQTGIDYLMVDEAHHYSNLRTLSNIPNVGTSGSNMATDLHMKMEYLREHNQSGRVATFATGTPVRNTVTQTYIMQRYLRPDLLRAAGLTTFDAWAATFGQVVDEMELKPEGSGFRQTSRFAKFQNVPELLRMMHVFADIKLAEDLDLPTPNLVGGRTETVTVPSSDARRAFIAELGERAEKVRSGGVPPEVDNMLKISGDGRKAALAMKLVGQDDEEPGKIEAAADRIGAIYAETKDRVYPVDPNNPEAGDDPTPGALQIVFLDLGTPKAAKGKGAGQSMDDNDTDWNGYEALRTQLAERGVPPEQVAFIHDAKNDAEKAEMFARARAGKISVLIGSTEKMGVGTNVQRRAVALHHLDAPWRPSDVEQRDGRIMRQGNLNEDVQIIRYVTEGSFDAYMWQTLERKAKFINQIMRGSLDVREIEDVGETALSYAEVKALATGNPDLMAKSKVDTLAGKLERLLRTHTRTQTNNANMVGILSAGAEQADANAALLDQAAAQRVDTRGSAFRMEMAIPGRNGQFGKPVDKRDAAADLLRTNLAEFARLGDTSYYRMPEPRVVGRIGGHTVVAEYQRKTSGGVVVLRFDGVPGEIGEIPTTDIARTNQLPRLERALGAFEARAVAERERAEANRVEAERVRQRVGIEFPRMAELEAARAKAGRLTEKMQRDTLRDQFRSQDRDWTNPEVAATLEPELLARLRFDPRVDSDEFDSPLLERDTTTDPMAGEFNSAAARARILAAGSTVTEPAAPSQPADGRPFRSVQAVKDHLEENDVPGYTAGSRNIDWDTALLSPGGGLFMFRSHGRPANWRIAHTGTGLTLATQVPGGKTGTRQLMGALEQVVAPNGSPIDWTIPDGDAMRAAIRESGFLPGALLEAARAVADRPKDVGSAA